MSAFRLGIFVVGSLAILTGAIFLIGSRKLDWSATYAVQARFPNAGGLQAGADVRVGGIRLGTVRSIDLPRTPQGKVTVRMDLKSNTRAVVKKDSVASIETEGLIGDEYVAISFGSTEGAAIRNGDEIAGQPPLEMSALFKKANGILDQLNGTSQNLDAISGKINDGSGTVGALINDKSLYNKVNAGATQFQEDAQALQHNFLLRGFFKNRGYADSAELTRDEIKNLPPESSSKEFTLDSKSLFAKPDTAKLKDEKALNPAGEFLENNPFEIAVVAVLGSAKGDTDEEAKLTLARAAVVREYLVHNFRLDDKRVKTIGIPKQAQAPAGQVEVLVYAKAAPRESH
jgi:phospholipid/cholesterol/gamma-HCH transport system substrate-binding protein